MIRNLEKKNRFREKNTNVLKDLKKRRYYRGYLQPC